MFLPRVLLLFFLLLGWQFPVFAQDVRVAGQVLAQGSRAPVPFVNIGIRGKNIGTAADEAGRFSLPVPASRANDTLTFSAVGYQEQAVSIHQLLRAPLFKVELVEKTTALPEVVVRGRPEKTRRIGTTTHNPFLWGNLRTRGAHDIVEFALLIPLHNVASRLVQAHIFLRRPTVDTVTLRLNFYRATAAQPGERLVEQPVMVRSAIRNGWLTIDLARYGLTLQADFYLSFEFLPEQQRPVPEFSYGAQLGGAALVRTSSLGTWRREPGASLAAYVTVKQ